MSWRDLLHENGHTVDEIEELFEEKTRWLNEDKTHVTVTDQLTKEKRKIKHGRAATQIQHDFPIKMLVLEELLHSEPQLRFGYYVVSTDHLRNTGDIMLSWGQFSPHTPPGDFHALIEDAEHRGIL